MDTKEYILELLKNGMWIFPVIGKAKTIDVAKHPASFCRIGGKDLDILTLVRKTPREILEKSRDSKGKLRVGKLCVEHYGGDYITWKSPEILSISEDFARKGHRAWGIWLLESERFGFDIDIYKSDLSRKQ